MPPPCTTVPHTRFQTLTSGRWGKLPGKCLSTVRGGRRAHVARLVVVDVAVRDRRCGLVDIDAAAPLHDSAARTISDFFTYGRRRRAWAAARAARAARVAHRYVR